MRHGRPKSGDSFYLSHHVLIDVVGDDQDIVAFAFFCHHLNLRPAEDLAQRVVGVVEDEGLGLVGEEALQLFFVQLPVVRGDFALGLGLWEEREERICWSQSLG